MNLHELESAVLAGNFALGARATRAFVKERSPTATLLPPVAGHAPPSGLPSPMVPRTSDLVDGVFADTLIKLNKLRQ